MSRLVHIILVAYHGAESLDRALESVAGQSLVTVVDNSQSDAVAAVCRGRSVAYRRTGVNLGFSGGVNVALREILIGAPCDVLLLNPDSVIPEGAIPELQHALLADRQASAVTPAIVYATGLPQRVLWPFPSPAQAWIEALGLARFDRHSRFAVGTVLLLRWEALQEIGLFDERFFLYSEETDWQWRAHACGWHAIVCNDIVATHVGGGSSADPARREQLFYAAQEIYVRKWYGSGGWFAYRAAVIAGAAIRALVLPRDRRSVAVRRLTTYLRGPCRLAAAGG